MKKYIPILILTFVLPTFVHAAWWNPFSWFKKKEVPVVQVQPAVNPFMVEEKEVQKPQKPEPVAPVAAKPKPVTAAPKVAPQTVQPQVIIPTPPPTPVVPVVQEPKYVDPVFSDECKAAKDKADELSERMYKMKNSSDAADFAVTYVMPAQNEVSSACGLYLPRRQSPSALCNDYTYSYSQTRSGTCSWHDGVLIWY